MHSLLRLSNLPPRLAALRLLALFFLLAGMLSLAPAPTHASAIASAARLTPRNFVPSLNAQGVMTVAYDLVNTGSATATSTRLTSLSLLSTANQPVGTRQSPAALPAALADIPAGGSSHLAVAFAGQTAGQRLKFSIAFSAAGPIGASTGFYLTVPAAQVVPITLTATPGNGAVTLTYNAVPGAASYSLYVTTDPAAAPSAYSYITNTSGTTYTQTGLKNGTTYYYVVVPQDSGGNAGTPSNITSALVSLPAPTNVTATSGSGSVTVTWTASAYPGATNYQVFYSTDNVNFYGLGYTGNTTTATQTGLANSTNYYYYVVPYNDGGAGTTSNTVSTTVGITAPTNVKATPGNGSVTVTWDAVTTATNYQVFYSSDGTNFYGLGYAGNVTTITQTGLSNATKYYYYVVAYNSGGSSPPSATVSATPILPAPTNVTATAGDSSVKIDWTASAAPGATNYQVFYSTDNVNFYGLGYTGNVTTTIQGGLTNGTKYYYYVVAYNAGGSSPNSTVVSATVGLGAPTNVKLAPGDGSVTVTWDAVFTATNYQVFYSSDGTNFYGLGYAGNVTTITQTGLSNATKYYYYVVAYNAGGPGPNSATVSTTVSLPAPTNVKATAGDSSVKIDWTASAFPGATNYQVFYSSDGTNFYGLGYTGGALTATQGSLTNGTTYTYYVVAYNNGGASPISLKASALVSLPAPTNLNAAPGNGSVTITWTASAYPGATNYQVFYSSDGTNFYGLGYAGNTTTFTQGGLTNGTKYYYYVLPYNNGGGGTKSGTVSATPAAPAS